MEKCEDIHQTPGMKELYLLRKETIEWIFGNTKENPGFRYTQMFGKVRMEMKVGLTFACMNLKKLAKIKAKRGLLEKGISQIFSILDTIWSLKEKWLWCVCTRAALSTVWGCNTHLYYSHSSLYSIFIFLYKSFYPCQPILLLFSTFLWSSQCSYTLLFIHQYI